MKPRHHFAAIAISTVLLCPSGGAESFPASITVSGEWVTLGDVADASGPLADVRVAPAPEPGETLSLDPGFVGRIARGNGVYFPADQTAPIRISRALGGSIGNEAQGLKPRPSAEHILVLTENIRRGELITANHITWKQTDKFLRAPSNAPSNMETIVGQEARRNLSAERPVLASDVQPETVIRKGDPVTLVYASGNMRLTVSAKALENAHKGAAIRVLNSYSNRAIDAVAFASGEAHVKSF